MSITTGSPFKGKLRKNRIRRTVGRSPSPRWGEGKVRLDLTPSLPSGERVVRRSEHRVRGQLESIWNSFPPSGWQGNVPGARFSPSTYSVKPSQGFTLGWLRLQKKESESQPI